MPEKSAELRNSGIDVVGEIAWGAHVCHFYETKEDLLESLIPYFKTGLENHEFCFWVVFDPVEEDDARVALERAVPGVDSHFRAGDIEILRYNEWYLQDGVFDLRRVISDWKRKLEEALAKGYAGMRVNGSAAWLTETEWEDFAEYEERLNAFIADLRMIVLCSYPAGARRANDLLDVVRAHQLVVARRRGEWEVLESGALQQARDALRRMNEELEQRVIQRTVELEAANNDLRNEIKERRRTEDELRESEQRFRELAENINDVFWLNTPDFKHALYVSPNYERVWGRTRESVHQDLQSFIDAIHPDDRPLSAAFFEGSRDQGFEIEYRIVRPDGSMRWIWDRRFPIKDHRGRVSRFAGIAQDISERKEAEAALRALSGRLLSLADEERRRLARELHDTTAQLLAALCMNLSVVNESADILTSRPRAALAESVTLADRCLREIRTVSYLLHPRELDELGLESALSRYIDGFIQRSEIGVEIEVSPDMGRLPQALETTIFRVVQECLTNIHRHSGSGTANVRIMRGPSVLVMEISDVGHGIRGDAPSGVGIASMRERIKQLDGSLEIDSHQGGTTVRVTIPLSRAGV